jgi:hypothetical protein
MDGAAASKKELVDSRALISLGVPQILIFTNEVFSKGGVS